MYVVAKFTHNVLLSITSFFERSTEFLYFAFSLVYNRKKRVLRDELDHPSLNFCGFYFQKSHPHLNIRSDSLTSFPCQTPYCESAESHPPAQFSLNVHRWNLITLGVVFHCRLSVLSHGSHILLLILILHSSP